MPYYTLSVYNVIRKQIHFHMFIYLVLHTGVLYTQTLIERKHCKLNFLTEQLLTSSPSRTHCELNIVKVIHVGILVTFFQFESHSFSSEQLLEERSDSDTVHILKSLVLQLKSIPSPCSNRTSRLYGAERLLIVYITSLMYLQAADVGFLKIFSLKHKTFYSAGCQQRKATCQHKLEVKFS